MISETHHYCEHDAHLDLDPAFELIYLSQPSIYDDSEDPRENYPEKFGTPDDDFSFDYDDEGEEKELYR